MQTQIFNVSRAKRIAIAEVSLHSYTWAELVDLLSKHRVSEDKSKCNYFVGATFKDNYRNKENLISTSLMTIDVDKFEGTAEDVLSKIQRTLPYSLVLYSTFRSTSNVPRFRIIIPLTREIPARDYEPLCLALCDEYKEFTVDKCGFKLELPMYLPYAPTSRIDDAFSYVKDVENYLDPDDFDIEAYRPSCVIAKGDGDNGENGDGEQDDLEGFLAQQPLDLTSDEIEDALAHYPAEDLDYDQWFQVGTALHHQFMGSDEGLNKWKEWSVKSSKHNVKDMGMKYNSINKDKRDNPLTFATVLKHANENRELKAKTIFNEVVEGEHEEGVAAVVDNDSYNELRKRIRKLPLKDLPETSRQQMAQSIFNSWGKSVGITKAAIKKELMPIRKAVINDKADIPDWVKDWVYILTECKFHNIEKNYSIRKEAFNAQFDREAESVSADVPASQLALVDYEIPTVVDAMYWPNMGSIYEYDGKKMLNSYTPSGCAGCDSLEGDEDGQAVVDLFLAHLKMTLSDAREQGIVLDWMSHIVQNPGVRVNWALLLQGTQGTGKSYFGKLLQDMLGTNVHMLDPGALMGRFTGWAHRSILNIVEEIRISGAERYSLLDKLKAYITNETIQIEEKGKDHRTIPNFTSYFFLTNHKDAIPIDNEDRRYCILYGDIQSKEQLYKQLGGADGVDAYFSKLFNETERRIDALKFYFLNREISSEFKHKGRAPLTNARESMIDYSANIEVENLQDLINKYECEVINDSLVDITHLTNCIKADFDADNIQLPNSTMLKHIMLEMGFEKIKSRVDVPTNDGKRVKHTVWFKNTKKGVAPQIVVKNFHKRDEY